MIKINVKKENDVINEILIKGHALYDDYGKDIVCAAVSSIVITTVNAIESIDNKAISYDEKVFIIKVLKQDEIINKLINNMINLLKELEHDYPNNIKFLQEEYLC